MKIRIEKVEEYSNCKKITVSTNIGGKKYEERFSVSHEQYESGKWKGVITKWIENLKHKPKKVERLEGKEINI